MNWVKFLRASVKRADSHRKDAPRRRESFTKVKGMAREPRLFCIGLDWTWT